MPRNLEIKTKLRSVEFGEKVARSIGAEYNATLHQTDTYFNVPLGRLKLREIVPGGAELIFYDRPEDSTQRVSDFRILPCDQPEALKKILADALSARAVVKKKRVLYMYNTTRIHLDEVEGLGTFLEFEVPCDSDPDEAKRTADFLAQRFELKESDYIRTSYVDLLTASER